MTTQNNTASGGASIVGLLGIAFVVLKLTGVIDWSWWLVTLPFWGGFALLLVFLAVAFLVVVLTPAPSRRKSGKR